MKMVDTMSFSERYPKLEDPVFTTIRRSDKYGEGGDRVRVVVKGEQEFDAVILMKVSANLSSLSTQFLTYDTGADSRNEAVDILREFCVDLDADAELTVYLLKKISEE